MAEFKIDRLRYTWKGNWSSGIQYYKDDVVANIGSSWVCVRQHTSSSFNDDLTAAEPAWTKMTEGIVWKGDWESSRTYDVNDVIKYGSIVYRCLERHTSGALLENDQSKWLVYVEGFSFQGAYAPNTRYTAGDLVVYNGSLLSSNIGQTTGSTFNENNWTLEIPGSKVQGTWNSSTLYGVGSVVRHGGWLYYSLTNNINKIPTRSIYSDEQPLPDWTLLSKGIRFQGTWSPFGDYLTGDVVRRGGELWVALVDTNITGVDGSTLDYLDETNWEKINIGHNWRERWEQNTNYAVGDLVRYTGGVWRSNIGHLSSGENFPGDNGSGFFYWDLFLAADELSGLTGPGDLLTFGLSRELAGDTSTFGPTNLPIGNDGELLFVGADDSLEYKTYGLVPRFYFVTPTGIDSPDRGTTIASPWRTIRYACERANDGYSGNTLIEVSTGIYEEILPIIVPPRTSIAGQEIRSVVVRPKTADASLSGDRIFTLAALSRISILIPDILTGVIVQKTASNPLEQQVSANVSTSAVATQIQNIIVGIQTYINFYLAGTGTEPAITGSNDAASTEAVNNARSLLTSNRSFIAEEAYNYTITNFPAATISRTFYINNFERFVDAWSYDIFYPGNYRSLLEARYYRNAVLGSNNETMFYLRDTTGVKFLRMEGFVGVLNKEENLYEPVGGIYTSLDPGWGPDDRNTWITVRSPYTRSITLSGTACIGFKVDGNFHNGGNRTLIYNDYTCLLSDGIGCWVANGGRAEIVSVFTYYANVSYYATNGGIIRSLTGNSSYGNFGVVADGIDTSESVQEATVNNRTNEAQLGSIFAGANGSNLLVEWANAGQEYTDASLSIIGSGVQADAVFEDFRDNAVFECRLLDTNLENDFVQVIGGRGYIGLSANAGANPVPGGDEYSIKISDSDINTEATYLGMRLTITAGTGVGQYGYISAYNTGNKIVSINKETTNEPGWDHVVPGTPYAPLLDTSTRYTIEPRPVFEPPPFIATEHEIPIPASEEFSTDWISVVYGETTQTFTNLLANGGIILANFSVVKTQRNYTSVTRVSGGEGYSVGQEITIAGNLLGGYTPENDITITVTRVTGNGIIAANGFTYTGQAGSGRFVATSSFGNNTVYSIDGENWSEGSLPAQPGNVKGTWKALAYGEGVFVAIRRGSNRAATSIDGINWTNRTMPLSRDWTAVAYGNGRFVAISENFNSAAYSNNGLTWVSALMPTVGDSSINEWIDITYGKGKFVAIANSQNVIGYSEDGITWEGNAELSDTLDSTQRDWISIAYGNNRYVVLSTTGDCAYSFDAITWYQSSLPNQDGSTPLFWRQIRYSQGVFFAVGDTGGREVAGDSTIPNTSFAATSADGVYWTERTLATEAEWRGVGFGNPYTPAEDSSVGRNTPMWIVVAKESDKINKIRTGAKAIARCITSRNAISAVRIWDPGSGYIEGPEVTVIHPQQGSGFIEVGIEVRDADGVLANPSWVNRGFGYSPVNTRGTVSGDGFADIKQTGRNFIVDGLERLPKLGSQIVVTDSERRYQVSNTTVLSSNGNGTLTLQIAINQDIRVREDYEHGRAMSIREKFSQIRMTGHDFLDIGTGNFVETNYPELYALNDPIDNLPENEATEIDGGRTFFTATDQAGNFNVGTLFGVEQATGVVDVNADFFDFGGLSELQIGGIRVGSAPVVIREFSSDAALTENSNNVVPTQRAIASYLSDRLSLGGQALSIPTFIAGQVRVGPEEISNTNNLIIRFPVKANFSGNRLVVRGSIIAQSYFITGDLRSGEL